MRTVNRIFKEPITCQTPEFGRFNQMAWRFGGQLKWEPVRLIDSWLIRILYGEKLVVRDDGEGFFDSPGSFYEVTREEASPEDKGDE